MYSSRPKNSGDLAVIEESPNSNVNQEEIKNSDFESMYIKLVDQQDAGLAVFQDATNRQRSVVLFHLIVCNPAFKALFDIDTMPLSQTFSQNIFRLYHQSNKQFSFFRLLEKFVKSG